MTFATFKNCGFLPKPLDVRTRKHAGRFICWKFFGWILKSCAVIANEALGVRMDSVNSYESFVVTSVRSSVYRMQLRQSVS